MILSNDGQMVINIYLLYCISLRIMSTESFNEKIIEAEKLNSALRKDLDYRRQLAKQQKPLFDIDAEIRGTLKQLEDLQWEIERIYLNFQKNPTNFGLTNHQLSKRADRVTSLKNEIKASQNTYDSFFVVRQKPTTQNQKRAEYQNMNKAQLIDQKKKQEQDQEEILDQLINVVKNVKKGNEDIEEVLDQQDKQLNELGKVMDLNMNKMGKVKRNMMKLLDGSGYACLTLVIILEIIGIICQVLFWNP